MRSLRFLSAFAALIAAFAFVVACGGSEPEPQSSWTGSDVDTLPDEAQDAIEGAIETMFTWYPTKDASTRDAYERASKYLTPELAAANHATERGTSVWWDEWKAADASVIADALIVFGEHPKDSDDAVERAVMLNQKVTAPDGTVLEETDLRVDRVAAVKQNGDWRVSVISFFPDLPTQAPPPPPCAQGESRQPPPAGPCSPIPAPPPTGPQTQPPSVGPGTAPPDTGTAGTACPGGATVPAGQPCPSSPGPASCEGGMTVPAGQTCPPPPPPCEDGSPRLPGGSCPPPPPDLCEDGSPRLPDGSCPPPEEPCDPGSYRLPDGTCYTPPTCPDGSYPLADGTCYTPPECDRGSYPLPDGTCYTPDDGDRSHNIWCPPGNYTSDRCRRHTPRLRSRTGTG